MCKFSISTRILFAISKSNPVEYASWNLMPWYISKTLNTRCQNEHVSVKTLNTNTSTQIQKSVPGMYLMSGKIN